MELLVSKNSAVLQTIESCLPKVDGWEIIRFLRAALPSQHEREKRTQTYSNSELRVNDTRVIKPDQKWHYVPYWNDFKLLNW
jgi:hypothetical protein